MSGLRALVALFAAAMVGAVAHAAPLEAYGGLPSIESIEISPNGQRLAAVITNGEERAVLVKEVATGQVLVRASTGTVKIRFIRWAGDDDLILVKTVTASPIDVQTTQREWAMAFGLNVQTQKVTRLMDKAGGAMNTIYGLPSVRTVGGKPAVFVQGIQFVNGQGRVSLFRVDPRMGSVKLIETGEPDTRDWVVGPDGRPLAQELYNLRTGRWSVKLKSNTGWREAETVTALLDPPDLAGLGRTPDSVLVAEEDDQHHPVWRELRADGSPPSDPIPVREGQGALRDETGGVLTGHAALVDDELRITYFDPQDAKIWKAVTAAFPNSMVAPESWSADHTRVVVKVDSPTEGPAFSLVDLRTCHADWIGAEYQGLGKGDFGPRSSVRFKARDGLQLSGYLTTPPGREIRNLPLIVLPHGGPAARDMPGFDWWSQAMASRGYAILQVNYRGSAGFGEGFLRAGYGEWGRTMQTDLSDGVAYLAGLGQIDPKRVCIVGASYGGYAALAGAALDPGVYRCAVAVAGISDMKRFVVWSRNVHGSAAYRYWNRFMGSEDAGDPVLAEISPIDHLDRVSIPLLLIHGKDDSVVPLDQSRAMADAMKKAGKPVELLVLKGEDHWFSLGETRREMLTATMAFVEKQNPPN